jgi:hypothetical protein
MLCTGCAEWKWRYQPDPPTQRNPLLANTVAVPALSDERAPLTKPDIALNVLLGFLPGVLFQTQEWERMEEASNGQWHFQPSEDVSRAVADEVRNRQIFKSVTFSRNGVDGELVLRGRLISTHVTRTVYQYGLTIVGAVYLALLGPPMQKLRFTLELDLTLNEPQTQSVLWQRTYKKEREILDGLYYGIKEGEIQYDAMLKETMPQILSDLEAAIKGMTTAAANDGEPK